jgi:hypothetical protein
LASELDTYLKHVQVIRKKTRLKVQGIMTQKLKTPSIHTACTRSDCHFCEKDGRLNITHRDQERQSGAFTVLTVEADGSCIQTIFGTESTAFPSRHFSAILDDDEEMRLRLVSSASAVTWKKSHSRDHSFLRGGGEPFLQPSDPRLPQPVAFLGHCTIRGCKCTKFIQFYHPSYRGGNGSMT